MFVTNWISPTKIQKISEITNFFRHYFLSRTEVVVGTLPGLLILFLALGEKMIVDKADTTKIIRKHFLLLLIRVKPKLI